MPGTLPAASFPGSSIGRAIRLLTEGCWFESNPGSSSTATPSRFDGVRPTSRRSSLPSGRFPRPADTRIARLVVPFLVDGQTVRMSGRACTHARSRRSFARTRSDGDVPRPGHVEWARPSYDLRGPNVDSGGQDATTRQSEGVVGGLRSGRVSVGLTPLQATGGPADRRTMRRLLVLTAAVAAALSLTGPAGAAGSSSIAALQVALQAHGFYPAAVDGVQGPLTTTGLTSLQRVKGIPVTGRLEPKTRSALGPLGRPLLGQRELGVGAVGWDVSSLEFQLDPVRPRPEGGRRPVHRRDRRVRSRGSRRRSASRPTASPGSSTYRALAGRTALGRLVHAADAGDARRRRRRELLLDLRALTASARCCSRSRTGSSSPR